MAYVSAVLAEAARQGGWAPVPGYNHEAWPQLYDLRCQTRCTVQLRHLRVFILIGLILQSQD